MEPNRTLAPIQQSLVAMGYSSERIFSPYDFADYVPTKPQIRQAALAAFGEDPISYRTACIGVIDDPQKAVSDLWSLGTPIVLVVAGEVTRVLRVTPDKRFQKIQELATNQLRNELLRHQDLLNPASILRAKAMNQAVAPMQIDLADYGIVPALDSMVQTKLDSLLRSLIRRAVEIYNEEYGTPPDFSHLYRGVFHLVTAKILIDRGFQNFSMSDDYRDVLKNLYRTYLTDSDPAGFWLPSSLAQELWNEIHTGWYFQNISVETLALVYENTLVTQTSRKPLAIYRTPPSVTQYLVRQIPWDQIPQESRTVFEPFAGSAGLLIAALSQLRSLLPISWSPRDQHRYLVDHLFGMELDPFAVEVAKLALMLADYPHADGWHITIGDVFADTMVDQLLQTAKIVLANPPFEAFSPSERQQYHVQNTRKPIATLERILAFNPYAIGVVLPRTVTDGPQYHKIRRLLSRFRSIDLTLLPASTFSTANVETVGLVAYGKSSGTISVRNQWVHTQDELVRLGAMASPHATVHDIAVPEGQEVPLHEDLFADIWQMIAHYPTLEHFVELHRGIEYTEGHPIIESDELCPGFQLGIRTVKGSRFGPYEIGHPIYLSMDRRYIRRPSGDLAWDLPKVIVNATRLSQSHWPLAAVFDEDGLVFSDNFISLWPKNNDIPLEVLTAILNSPIANAYIVDTQHTHGNRRRLILDWLKAIPIPPRRSLAIEQISALVRQIQETLKNHRTPEHEVWLALDAEILRGYDLSPMAEKRLLQWFAGSRRPGISLPWFYYDDSVRFAIPLRMVVEGLLDRSSIQATQQQISIVQDPAAIAWSEQFMEIGD